MLDVFLGQQRAEGLAEVAYNRTTGNIVLKLKPVAMQVMRREKGERQPKRRITLKEARAMNKAMRRLPLHFYAVVDYFAGSIKASTPIADVERLQEQRGPAWLGRIAALCQGLFWWAYALGFYFSLVNCSYIFFRAATTSSLIFAWGAGLLVVGLALKGVELLIMKTTTRPQRKLAPSVPLTLDDMEYVR